MGTANTLVYVKDRGIVLREPSVVAIRHSDRKVIAVGDESKLASLTAAQYEGVKGLLTVADPKVFSQQPKLSWWPMRLPSSADLTSFRSEFLRLPSSRVQ